MLTSNAIATIQRLTGDQDSKEYVELKTGVRILLMAAGNDIALMFNVPIGQVYSFVIKNGVDTIKPTDKFIISDPQTSGLEANDVFFVKGEAKKSLLMGNTVITGVCVKH